MSDAPRYPVPAREHRVEEIVKRSRFLTAVARAPDPTAAHAFVARVRDEFPDATHHCWAFVAGPPGSTAHVGMSDDGEPHGTAGRPMLNALLHGGVGEIVAVCTRWFGGVKLGTGGLSRAYSGGVTLALDSLPTEEKVERVEIVVTVGYSDVDALGRYLSGADVVVVSQTFGEEVTTRVGVPVPDVDAFRVAVGDLSQGRARVREG